MACMLCLLALAPWLSEPRSQGSGMADTAAGVAGLLKIVLSLKK